MALLGHVKAGRNEQGASWGTFNGNHTCGLCVAVTGSAFVTSAELQGEGMQFRNMFDGAGVKRHHSAIPTAINWRLFIMRLQFEWLQRKCLFQAVMRHSLSLRGR
jgi:hypothetical protein